MSARGTRTGYAFLDTNVLVYAYDLQAAHKREKARALMESLWAGRMGCLSVQVLEEFYVTMTRGAKPLLDSTTAQVIVEDMAQWRIHAPRAADVLQAIRIHQRYGISLWDALIIWSAASLGCEVLWSEDLAAGQVYAGVHVENPFV